jgi:hypothetical protein
MTPPQQPRCCSPQKTPRPAATMSRSTGKGALVTSGLPLLKYAQPPQALKVSAALTHAVRILSYCILAFLLTGPG